MPEDYKRLYHQMKKMVEKYQDEIVPGLRAVIERQEKELNNVVHCRDCRWGDNVNHPGKVLCEHDGGPIEYKDPDGYCDWGEKEVQHE